MYNAMKRIDVCLHRFIQQVKASKHLTIKFHVYVEMLSHGMFRGSFL